MLPWVKLNTANAYETMMYISYPKKRNNFLGIRVRYDISMQIRFMDDNRRGQAIYGYSIWCLLITFKYKKSFLPELEHFISIGIRQTSDTEIGQDK